MTTITPIKDIITLATNGTYHGWYNLITTYEHADGSTGDHIYEAKGELVIKDGNITMGDATHGYDHYNFGTELDDMLEEADSEGEDAFAILEDSGWTPVDTEYILVHNDNLETLLQLQ
jgi:hypothetical protein